MLRADRLGADLTEEVDLDRRIDDFVDDNPSVEILPVDYVNDPNVICQNDNMISTDGLSSTKS